MLLSTESLSALQQKLSVESRRGVHLNAIPGRSRVKFDAQRIALIHPELPQQLLTNLHNKISFELPISIAQNDLAKMASPAILEVARKLNLLHYEVEDVLSEKGIHTFGFAYPLIAKRDAKGKLLVAPLLIWPLQISRPNKKSTWLLKKTEEDKVILNEVLLRHLRNDAGIDLSQLHELLPEEGPLSVDQLKKITSCFLDGLEEEKKGGDQGKHRKGIERVKGNRRRKGDFLLLGEKELLTGGIQGISGRKDFEKEKLEKARICWSGLFALFETQHQSIIQDYDQLLQKEKTDLNLGVFTPTLLEEKENRELNKSALTCVKTDDSQQRILNALSLKKNILIHGPPGTGKSQILTAIIINAITKGEKILLVCGKQTALQVVEDALKTKELHNLTALLKEVKKDRRAVVQKVRQVVDDRNFYIGEGSLFANNNFEEQLEYCQSLIREINSCHDFLQEKTWGEYTWTDIVGFYLEIDIEKVDQNTSPDLFSELPEISVEEWKQMVLLLQKGESLFEKAQPLLDTEIYSLDFFKLGKEAELRDNMKDNLEEHQQSLVKLEVLNRKFEDHAQQYLLGKYERVFEQVKQQIALVKEQLGKSTAGDDTEQQRLTPQQENGLNYYRQLCDFMVEEEGPAYEPRHTEKPAEVLLELNAIKSGMDQWRKTWNRNIEKTIAKIGGGTAHDELEELPIYEKLLDEIKRLIFVLNKEKYFQGKLLLQRTVDDSLLYIENKLSKLNELLITDGDFSKMYKWSQFYNQQEESVQHIITKVKQVKEWASVYSFQLFNSLLQKRQDKSANIKSETYENLRQGLKKLEQHQIPFIQSYWREKQRRAVIHYHEQNRLRVENLYNKRSTAANKKFSLRTIVEKDLTLFQSFFPVVLTSPEVASTLFSNFSGEHAFDLVLFDEASQLKLEETIPALLKGKQKIIAGDEHQMPPSFYFGKIEPKEEWTENTELAWREKFPLESALSITTDNVILPGDHKKQEGSTALKKEVTTTNANSLLNFAMNLPFEHHYLDFHYRSKHPALIDFSNAAFYGDRLCPMPAKSSDTPILFIPVNGLYLEGLNEAEADAIVLFLKDQTRNQDGFYSSIGIATFNVKQRNLIFEKIRAEEMLSQAFAAKMIKLRESGLFVKNLENIQGDERDVMLISTVYGKAPDGKFSSRFGPINQQEGYKLLNVIITRAKHLLLVFSSIPEKIYQSFKKYLERDGNTRKGIFYAWLAYAKAINDGNTSASNQILSILRKQRKTAKTEAKNKETKSPSPDQSLFAKAIYQKILPHLKQGKLELNANIAGFKIDLLYRSPNGQTIIIECDGVNNGTGLHKEEMLLENSNSTALISYYRIWSVDWWMEEEASLRKLLKVLLQK